MAAGVSREAVGRGAALAFVIVVPAAFAQLVVGPGAVRSALLIVVLVGFGAGGHRAATLAPLAPLTNAGLAALVAFVLAQLSWIVLGVLRGGGGVTPVGLAFLAMLATSCGMVGALVALRRRAGGTASP